MAASSRAHTNVTTINLASNSGKKVQSTDDILKQIESTLPEVSQQNLAQRGGGLSARLQGRINEHELTFGDKSLPRQRLPKVDNALMDRYQAARQNVLVLGAIQQVEKANTHRSGKSGSHTPHTVGSHTPHHGPASACSGAAPAAAGALGPSGSTELWDEESVPLGPSASGYDSAFSSFKSRVSSKALGSIPEDDGGLSAQASGMNLNPEASHISSKPGRRYARQASNSSVGSRVSAASFASGLTGASAVSSSGQDQHLRQQHSYLSSGGSSGHTLRSHRAGSVAGSSWAGSHKKASKRKAAKPEPGRVTRAFAEFGSKDDWVSKTLLKHTLAAIIQAHWRGFYVRQRWKVNKEQLVLDEQARIEADSLQQQRLQELQYKLQMYQQKKLAQAAAEAAAVAAAASTRAPDAEPGVSTAAAVPMADRGSSSVMSRAVSVAYNEGERGLGDGSSLRSMHSAKSVGEGSYAAGNIQGACCGSDSDSGWSDVELDDVAAIKFRAVTPPWQRGAELQQLSLQLQQRIAAAAAAATGQSLEAGTVYWGDGLSGMTCCWDSGTEDNTAKLQELRHRRICRKPDPVVLSAPAVAAAATSGLLTSPLAAADSEQGTAGPGDAAAGPDDAEDSGQGLAAAALPQYVVEALLLERYNSKYNRLGLPHKMPGRERWHKMQATTGAAASLQDLHEEEESGTAAQGTDLAAAAGPDAPNGTTVAPGPPSPAAVQDTLPPSEK